MRKHSAKGLYRRGFWDLGGSLNELDPPSEVPERDVLECVNWRVHKDGRSREKRPGYTKLLTVPDVSEVGGEPVLQTHEHIDANNFESLFAITSEAIKMRKDTYGYTSKRTMTESYPFKKLLIYDDKLVTFESDASIKTKAITSVDGTTWTTLFTSTYAHNQYCCADAVVFNDHLFFNRYDSVTANPKVVEWDGASFTEHLALTDYFVYGLVLFDGKLWCISDGCGGVDYERVVRYWNGTSWSSITDYDGDSYLDYNTTKNPECSVKTRTTRLFVFNSELYLMGSRYNSTLSKWTWQVWKFRASSYDQFNKIYETDDDYALSSIVEHQGKVHVTGNKLVNANGNATKVARLYSSENMANWTVEGEFATLGFPSNELVFDGRLYLNCLDIHDSGNTKIWYLNRLTKIFVLEQTFATHVDANDGGGLANFLTDLYIGKYKEIYKRVVTEDAWTDIYYFKTPINYPPSKVVFADRLIISTPDANIMIEGDTVHSLGIGAPTTAPVLAAGDAGDLTGDFSYVVTFYRSGNYPCESNPSPVSNTESFTSKKGSLTGIPISADPKVNARRIYRTKANGAIYSWLEDINDNTTTELLNENYADDELGDEVSYGRLPPPTGKYFEVWDNRLWIAGNAEFPNLLYPTNTGTAEEWDGETFLPIARREREVLMQIKAFGDKLYALKTSHAWEVEKAGDSYYIVNQLEQAIGTDASWSVAVCDRFLIWKSEFGIEVFNGERCFRPIPSELIRRTIASINPEQLDKCMGGHNMVDGQYWLMVPTGVSESPDKTIVLDYLDKRFTLYEFDEGINFLLNQKTAAEGLRTLLQTPDGNIHIWAEGWTDNETVVSANFKTGWIYMAGVNQVWNILRRMFIKYILPADKTITMKIYRNFKKTAFATISLAGYTPTTIPELRNEILRRLNLGVRGYYVMFEFINNEDTEGECRIIGWDSYFKKRVWKKTVQAD